MVALMMVLVVSAAPAEGSRWSWSIDDSRSVKLTPAHSGLKATGPATLQKSQVEVTVISSSKLKLIIKKGAAALVGSEGEVESNYGELIARKTKGPSTKTFAQDFGGVPEPSLNEWNGTLAAVARVLMPEPVIAAASSGEPCSEKTRAAVAEATAVMIQRVYSVNGAESATYDSTLTSGAACGPAANTWAVKFKLELNRISNTITLNCSGSVKASPGAVFATYDLSCSGDSPLNVMHKSLRFKWSSGFKSSVAPLK